MRIVIDVPDNFLSPDQDDGKIVILLRDALSSFIQKRRDAPAYVEEISDRWTWDEKAAKIAEVERRVATARMILERGMITAAPEKTDRNKLRDIFFGKINYFLYGDDIVIPDGPSSDDPGTILEFASDGSLKNVIVYGRSPWKLSSTIPLEQPPATT